MRFTLKNLQIRAATLQEELLKEKIRIDLKAALDIIAKLEGYRTYQDMRDYIIEEESWRQMPRKHC